MARSLRGVVGAAAAAGAVAFFAWRARRRLLDRAAYAPLPLSRIHVASDAAHAERLLRCWRIAVALGLLPPALGLDVPADDLHLSASLVLKEDAG